MQEAAEATPSSFLKQNGAVGRFDPARLPIGCVWTEREVLELLSLPFFDLLASAHAVHRHYHDPYAIQISVLANIKQGGCSEDCAYCAQSARHKETDIEASKLALVDTVLRQAVEAKKNGASRFCMGAAWRSPKQRDMEPLLRMIKGVKALGLETCMTLGMLTDEQVDRFKEAGLDYYNHNLDTSRAYYAQIVTTHSYDDRLQTLQRLSEKGIKLCTGGIVGMGESRADRAALLATLASLPQPPASVPINMLIPMKGTPLEHTEPLDVFECVRTVAAARILMPQSFVRLSAGRQTMPDALQALCFYAGANSLFQGRKLLTADNKTASEDQNLFDRLGLRSLLHIEGELVPVEDADPLRV